MEFSFAEKTLSHLQLLTDTWLRQEETADLIVPDSSPDAEKVVDCFGTVTVRSVNCDHSGLQISGGIQAGILYLAQEERQPRLLETYLPFTISKALEGCHDGCLPVIQCRLSGCSGRIVNSRKLMLRLEICCGMQVFERQTQSFYIPEETDPRLQLHRVVCPIHLHLDAAQKLFTVEEELTLPAGRPAIDRLLHTRAVPQITESRIAGAKAVFKGILTLEMLYLSVDGEMERWQSQLPFSQYCDLSESYDEEQLQILLLLAGCDGNAEGQDMVSISVMLHAQCLVWGQRECCLIDDGYYRGGSLQAQLSSGSLRSLTPQQNHSQPMQIRVPVQMQSVQDVQIYLGCPELQQQADAAQLTVPVCVQLSGKDPAGLPSFGQCRGTVSLPCTTPSQTGCLVEAAVNPEVYTIPGGDAVEVRFHVDAQLQWHSLYSFEMICSVTAAPAPHRERPAVIAQRILQDTPVWELAKYYDSTCQGICAVNGIRDDLVPAGTLLLMPLE